MSAASTRRRIRIALIAAVVALVAGWFSFQVAAQPLQPSAFYTSPSDLPDGPPGTIVRSEPVTAPASGEKAWRVLYLSSDPSGTAIAVSGVIVAPDREPPAGGWPVIAWAHGTTGIVSRCAPSLERNGGIALVPEYSRIVDSGAVLAITDYPGLGTPGVHPYLDGQSEGRSVLDSIRAARGLLDGETNRTAAVFGHSQGGHAALFADQISPTYAPDIHLVGVAAMAPPTNLATLMTSDVHTTPGIVLTALALRSWSKVYPDASESTVVHQPARALVDDLATRCIENNLQNYTDAVDVVGLHAGFLVGDPTTAAGWARHFSANSAGALSTAVPVLISQGLADTIVWPEVTKSYAHAQCAAGASIELDTYAGIDHFGVRTVAASTVVGWLLDRVDGRASTPGCSTIAVPASTNTPHTTSTTNTEQELP